MTATTQASPEQADVDSLRVLLDDMANFADNDQRARFLLSSNWMRERLGRRQTVAELVDAVYLRLKNAERAKATR